MHRIRTNDGREYEISNALVEDCQLLNMVLNMTDDTVQRGVLPLPNINSELMDKILEFWGNGLLPEFTDPREMFPLLNAADYLGTKIVERRCGSSRRVSQRSLS